jgi:prohibitin 1
LQCGTQIDALKTNFNNMKIQALSTAAVALMMFSCTTIKQDQVGVKRTFGRVSDKVYKPGLVLFNPFFSTIIRTEVRTVNLSITANLPSKEGLNVQSDISILYRIKTDQFSNILRNTGLDFKEILILPVFRSAAADVCSKYEAKDMHSAKRSEIETEIRNRMMSVVNEKGFIIEAVLMKSITLPGGLAKAVEEKLQAEQDAQRMEFLKVREKLEADRIILKAEGEKQSRIIAAEGQKRVFEIEAEGKANATKIEADAQAQANDMLNRSLTPNIIKLRQIEAFENLSKSNNTKTVITDGKTPFLSLP